MSAARNLASKTNAKLYVRSYEDYLFTKEEQREEEKEHTIVYYMKMI